MRKAEIYYDKKLAGTLEENDFGYVFQYTPNYIESTVSLPVSLSLPLRAESYQDKRLFPFFDGLIPEGWLLDIAEQTWKLDPRDRMGLLLSCCHDCIGTISVIPVKEQNEN